jgi:hypothetical protein
MKLQKTMTFGNMEFCGKRNLAGGRSPGRAFRRILSTALKDAVLRTIGGSEREMI